MILFKPNIKKLTEKEDIEKLIDLSENSKSEALRHDACHALGEIILNLKKQKDIKRLIYISRNSKDPTVRKKSIIAASKTILTMKKQKIDVDTSKNIISLIVENNCKEALDCLIPNLSHQNDEIRQKSFQALNNMGWSNKNMDKTIKYLMPALKDADKNVQQTAFETISEFDQSIAVPILIEIIKKESKPFGEIASKKLGKFQDLDTIKLLLDILKSDDYDVQPYIEKALISILEKTGIEALKKSITIYNKNIRQEITKVIKREKDSVSVKSIICNIKIIFLLDRLKKDFSIDELEEILTCDADIIEPYLPSIRKISIKPLVYHYKEYNISAQKMGKMLKKIDEENFVEHLQNALSDYYKKRLWSGVAEILVILKNYILEYELTEIFLKMYRRFESARNFKFSTYKEDLFSELAAKKLSGILIQFLPELLEELFSVVWHEEEVEILEEYGYDRVEYEEDETKQLLRIIGSSNKDIKATLNNAIIAASYQRTIKWTIDIRTDDNIRIIFGSDKHAISATKKLCSINNDLTTFILYLIKSKKSVYIKNDDPGLNGMPDRPGDYTLDFKKQKELARDELKSRGFSENNLDNIKKNIINL